MFVFDITDKIGGNLMHRDTPNTILCNLSDEIRRNSVHGGISVRGESKIILCNWSDE